VAWLLRGSLWLAVTMGIAVYGTVWCRLTFGVREFLMRARLEYDFFDIDRDPQAEAFVRTLGHGARRYPVVVMSGEVVVNPTMAELAGLVDALDTPRLPRRRRRSDGRHMRPADATDPQTGG
jgi:mycoredoxin